MKKDKSKSKSHETNIGKIIYGFLLFMPLIAVTSAILINTFNMQTKEKAEIHYTYQTNDVGGYTYNLRTGNVYHIDCYNSSFDEILPNLEVCRLRFYNLERFDIGQFENPYIDEMVLDVELYNKSSTFIDLIINGDDSSFYIGSGFNLNQNDYLYTVDTGISSYSSTICITGDFVLIDLYIDLSGTTSITNNAITSTSNIPFDTINLNNVSAEEVFYESINKVEQSNLFNWAQNSIIYTTLTATCTTLSINNTFIPLLLAYWLIISVIYILYDIALVMLMIFHHKVHELQDLI